MSKIRYKPDAKPILRKLHELIRQLELDSAKFFQDIGSTGVQTNVIVDVG